VIEHEFIGYIKKVYDHPISQIQITELRRAFFAGAKVALERPGDTEELSTECNRFLDAVKAGLK